MTIGIIRKRIRIVALVAALPIFLVVLLTALSGRPTYTIMSVGILLATLLFVPKQLDPKVAGKFSAPIFLLVFLGISVFAYRQEQYFLVFATILLVIIGAVALYQVVTKGRADSVKLLLILTLLLVALFIYSYVILNDVSVITGFAIFMSITLYRLAKYARSQHMQQEQNAQVNET